MSSVIKVLPLRSSRAHEACGPAAVSFAAIIAGQMQGSVLWISERWRQEQVHPEGLAIFCDPSKLVFASGTDQTEVLAASEEALRSGAVSAVISTLSKPLDLRQGRRLQLAAETGQSTGLFLIPEGMGSNAAETRWRSNPVYDAQDSTLMRWDLIKNKSGTLKSWLVRWDAEAHRVSVVHEDGK
ncbi:hypothetical protein HRQ87_19075 [Sulfitobacter sp. 1151]|uniref:Protein ImuA n=2 Tax=Parasulfitobacter algicola TaxID=2614809 RepID=A0ABX2J124_9RHOB|nr:hypothetical protein [Sulfitobacter algicola]